MTSWLAEKLERLTALPALLTARHRSLNGLRERSIRRVLVVCHGNIYRSAFVAAYLRRAHGSVEVRSAGFHPKPGRPAPEGHVAMSLEYGIDLRGHVSSLVRAEDLEWADIIVLMDRRNWMRLRAAGAKAGKIIWLGALVPGPVEILDPYGMDEAAAREVLRRLASCSEVLVRAIGAGANDEPR